MNLDRFQPPRPFEEERPTEDEVKERALEMADRWHDQKCDREAAEERHHMRMTEPQTPAEAAYRAWMLSMGQNEFAPFEELSPRDQTRWHAVADAVIYQARHIITEEMVRAARVTQQRTEAQ